MNQTLTYTLLLLMSALCLTACKEDEPEAKKVVVEYPEFYEQEGELEIVTEQNVINQSKKDTSPFQFPIPLSEFDLVQEKENRGMYICLIRDYLVHLSRVTGSHEHVNFTEQMVVDADVLYDSIPGEFLSERWDWRNFVIDHEREWRVQNQGNTQACVGCALASGVLDIMYSKPRFEKPSEPFQLKKNFSSRYLWMMGKELVERGSGLLDDRTLIIDASLAALNRYGCPPDSALPLDLTTKILDKPGFGLIDEQKLSRGCGFSRNSFKNHIIGVSFFEKDSTIEFELSDALKFHLIHFGPILLKLDVDNSWREAGSEDTISRARNITKQNHVVALIGYTETGNLIVRNCSGKAWSNDGYIELTPAYYKKVVSRAVGVLIRDNGYC